MRIRNLKRKSGEAVVPVWPPQWTTFSKPGDKLAVGDAGFLQSVERYGNRLTLTMRHDGRAHVGGLQWDQPPTVDAVETVLRANLGRPIKAVGDLDV